MKSEPFHVKDCSLIALSTGRHAGNLREFVSELQSIPIASVYHHFWSNRLQPRFEEPEYQNDFAAWARHGLHDPILSEQLAVLDPADFPNLEDLRREVIEIAEQRLATDDRVSWVQAQHPFSFVYDKTIIFDSNICVTTPQDFVIVLPRLSLGSIFFHFIDARRRPTVGIDDFRTWLTNFWPGHADLIGLLADVEPYFCTLAELRERIAFAFEQNFSGRNYARQT